MISAEDLGFFHVLAQAPSLAEAARKLNVTPPAVTQRLRALEARVGVKLIDRTSRRLSLTAEGELIATEGAAIIDAIEDLAERLASRTSQVGGHLRVAAPYGFGRRHVAPVVDAFARAHPAATVTLELSDSPIRQMAESWDIVVHIGVLPESDRLVTTLAPNRRILCAAPAYLEQAGPILKPEDIAVHRCLALRENNEDVTLWHFTHARHGRATVRIKPSMSSNDGEIVHDWALAGLGVMVRSEWDVAYDLATGRLLEILPKWPPPAADVVALIHARHGRSRRTDTFLQALRTALAPAPWRNHSRA
jgi:DNA-binding transcriptional LysR family regulator